MAIRLPNDLQRRLLAEGLVPPECLAIELVLPASGGVVLRYEVFASPEQLAALSRVLAVFIPQEVAR